MKDKEKLYLQPKNKKRKQKLKEKGITLIALVVTIILLLILAGVTISQIAGSNGLFQRARQAVEKYKNAAEEEQIQIGMLEQYVSDFSVVGGDEGEDKASVTIKTFTVEGNPKEQTIKVNLTIEGEASKIEYSIDNGKNWTTEETVSEDKTEYEHIFEELDLGKSYYVRVKVYDTEEKYVEAISDIVTLSNEMTATVADVLETKTFLTKDGSLLTGQMKNNGKLSEELSAGGEKIIPAGYTSGGTITVKSLKDLTPGDATAAQILNNKKAWVNGNQIIGGMTNYGSQTVTTSSVTTSGEYTQLTIPSNGYYDTNSKISTLSSNISSCNILWKNANPGTKIGNFTADCPGLSNYKYILIRSRYQIGNPEYYDYNLIDLSDDGCQKSISIKMKDGWIGARNFSIADNKITFTYGYMANAANVVQGDNNTWNIMCIPEVIYGVNITFPK